MARFKLSLFLISVLFSLTLSCTKNEQFDTPIDKYADLHPVKMSDGRYLFSWEDRYKSIKSIFLVGNFGYTKKVKMVDLNNDGIYRCALDLNPGTYYYKFLINHNLLAIPQHETQFNRQMNNAGHLLVPDESNPYISRIIPQHGKLVFKLNKIRFRINGKIKNLDQSKLRIYINGIRITHKYDPLTGWGEVSSFNKNWGEKRIVITDNKLFRKKATIYLYPQSKKREQRKILQGVTGYHLLIPYFNSQEGLKASLKTLLAKIEYLNSSKDEKNSSLKIKLLILHSLMPAEDPYHHLIKFFSGFDKKIANSYLLKEVATECHKRGIKLITHYNSGYMSNGNPLFQAVYGNPISFQRDWFFLDKQATKYQTFQDNPNQPLLNLKNTFAANYFINNLISWLRRGFGGFLMDNSGLQPTFWWERVRRTMPNSILIAKTTGGYNYKKQLFINKFNLFDDSQFPTQLLLAFSGTEPRKISGFMQENAKLSSAWGNLIHLSSQHDNLRPATVLNNPTKLKAMLGFLLTSGGIPVINWGDELGLKSRLAPLTYKPIKMDWKKVKTDFQNKLSLLNMIKKLSILRSKYEELNREIKNNKNVITWAEKKSDDWSGFIRSTTRQRFFTGVLAFEPTDSSASINFRNKLNLENGIYIGKDAIISDTKKYKIRIKNGKILKMKLPIKNRGFNLFLFEKN